MRRLQRKERYIFLLFIVPAAFFCWMFVLRFGIFGAEVDWFSQHSVLPDYFRKQFYETGEFFPEFAPNIGGGQNIYYFSYYGLYSPIILLSYLLPFVKMPDYMMAADFCCLVFSVMLMYRWLKRLKFSETTACGVSLLFLLAGPMIFHSYNQIMFVNYMPFLCMGLIGTDEYFKGRKRLLVISIFLMIMTSFYFSIGGILVLILYGLHRYLEGLSRRGERISFRGFLAEGIRFLTPFLTGVMMSGVLLVPTAMVLAGREGGTGIGSQAAPGIVLNTLLCPQVPVKRLLYSPYGIGLTTLSITSLAAMLIFPKLSDRILAWSCTAVFSVPVFAYLLNGGLYIRDKVMIPFLPLLCYITACYLRAVEEGLGEAEGKPKELGAHVNIRAVWNRCSICLPYLAPFLLMSVEKNQKEPALFQAMIILDGVTMLVCFFVFGKKRNTLFLLVPSVVFLILSGMAVNEREGGPVDRKFYEEVTDKDIRELTDKAAEDEKGFYRMEQLGSEKEDAVNLNRIWDMNQYVSSFYSSSFHSGYWRFRKETFEAEQPFRNFLMQPALHNPVFLRFMGVKYVISKEEIPGYTPAGKKGKWALYENIDVSPAAYATDKVITEEEYKRLEYPYNQLALLKYAVVKKNPFGGGKSQESVNQHLSDGVQEIAVCFPEHIQAGINQTFNIDIPDDENCGKDSERVLFVQFEVENLKSSEDVAVWVEGVRNKLTARKHFYYNANTKFSYTVPLRKGQKKAEILFGKGDYKVRNVKCYTGILPDAAEENLYQSEFHLDKKDTRGNIITGRIEVHDSACFVTTIPYDENFEILVDGRETQGERVNIEFLGFWLAEGEHVVEIVYHAPGVPAGKLVSTAGLFIFLLFFCFGETRARKIQAG